MIQKTRELLRPARRISGAGQTKSACWRANGRFQPSTYILAHQRGWMRRGLESRICLRISELGKR